MREVDNGEDKKGGKGENNDGQCVESTAPKATNCNVDDHAKNFI